MSLVNKMLRDLDARHVGERGALPTAVTPLPAARESLRRVLWFGVLLAAAAILGAAWYVNRETETPLPPVAAPAPRTVPPVQAPATPVAAALPAPPPPVAAVAVDIEPPGLRISAELAAPPVAVPEAEAAAPKPSPRAVAAPATLAPGVRPKVVEPTEPRIDKQARLPSAAERAELEYRVALQAQRQGNAEQAVASLRAALQDAPEHAAARQTLAALLIETRRFDEAEEVLRKGTELLPTRLASTLAWARLKVERNQAPAALELLQKYAATGERSADYQGFAGALLNRSGRAAEAVERYQAATRLAPSEGRWWAGLGIALDAAGQTTEAREAYLKARSLPGLPADLAQHIEQRLR